MPSRLELIATSRDALDLSDAAACRAAVERHRPDWVLNTGAYTAVDRAETEPDLAHAVNGGAPRAFAEAIQQLGGQLLQLSTDFVFNGRQGSPYRVEQPRDPLGVYGASKARGEEAIETVLGNNGQATVLRTSWVMGPVGRNFALTMLRLHRERDQLERGGRSGGLSQQHPQPGERLLAVDQQQSGATSSAALVRCRCGQLVRRLSRRRGPGC